MSPTQVGIVGAAPRAWCCHFCWNAGIESVVLEARDREFVERPGDREVLTSARSRSLRAMEHDDSTFGGLSPLTAILIVLALAVLGGLLYGAAGTRRNRESQPADGAPAASVRKRHSRTRRVMMWALRRAVLRFT